MFDRDFNCREVKTQNYVVASGSQAVHFDEKCQMPVRAAQNSFNENWLFKKGRKKWERRSENAAIPAEDEAMIKTIPRMAEAYAGLAVSRIRRGGMRFDRRPKTHLRAGERQMKNAPAETSRRAETNL